MAPQPGQNKTAYAAPGDDTFPALTDGEDFYVSSPDQEVEFDEQNREDAARGPLYNPHPQRPKRPPMNIAQIKSLSNRSSFDGVFVVKGTKPGVARNGAPFLMLEFGDNSGMLTSTLFSDGAAFEDGQSLAVGSVIRVLGETDTYQDRPSPKVSSINPVDPGTLPASTLAGLVETSPLDPDTMHTELKTYIGRITHPRLNAVVTAIMAGVWKEFKVRPAARGWHHAYMHGLLEHTLNVTRHVFDLGTYYRSQGMELDLDLAGAGAVLHDVMKVEEYSAGLAPSVTEAGYLRGHLYSGAQYVRRVSEEMKLDADIIDGLEHIILSHHGKPEHGAVVVPCTPEAWLVHVCDLLDAKMGNIAHVMRKNPGASLVQKTANMEGPLVLNRSALRAARPAREPAAPTPPAKPAKPAKPTKPATE